jgi:hypothetical protein
VLNSRSFPDTNQEIITEQFSLEVSLFVQTNFMALKA